MNKKTKLEEPVGFGGYKICIESSGAEKHLWYLCQYFFEQKEIAYLLATEDVDINHVDGIYGTTPLMEVMQPNCREEQEEFIQDRIKIMELLIEKGASVNPKIKGAGPLHLACKLFIPEFIALLLKHGAKLDTKDCSLKTPIDYLNYHLVKKSQWHRLSKEQITKQEKVRKILIKLGFEIRD